MARARPPGRPADAGDEARGRGRARRRLPRSRLRAGPPRGRTLERRGHREPPWASRASSRTSASRLRPRGDARRGRRRAPGRGPDDLAATCGGVRVVTLYAPNGRVVGSPFYEAKLAWYERLAPLAGDGVRPRAAARARRRLQRGARGRRRLGPAGLPRRDPRLAPEREAFARLVGGVSWTPTAGTTPSRAATRGGTTARATSTRTSACGSITCSPRARSPSAPCGRRSTARPARASRSPRTTRRSSSTWTSPATPWTRAGRRRTAGSRPAAREHG